MSLFNITELKTSTPKAASEIQSSSDYEGEEYSFIGNRKKQLIEVIHEIKPNQIIHFATQGAWSQHELLVQIVKKIGVVDELCIATWSITEDPMRYIAKLKEDGQIKSLYMLFGDRIANNQPKAYQMSLKVADSVHRDRTHAKVTTFQNDTWSICIIGSANYTHNRKMESGCIFINPTPTNFHRNWIRKAIAKEKPFAK